jgi:peptidoglycan hydrolase-like protein with peptidoglycan-binding domain/regulator of RNase E activity RraB
MDQKVLEAQQWYNTTYKGTTGYVAIDEDGITGAGTFKALVRALQFELGLTVDGGFGNGTLGKCPSIGQETKNKNLVKIIQCGFYCKGYSCGGIDGDYGLATRLATITFKSDAGFPNEDEALQPIFIKALLNTDAFKLVRTGEAYIRSAQQYLNANYVRKTNIIGLIPCNGVADRNMSKALIIALQYEEAGKTMTGVDGIYGNNTLNRAPELALGSIKTEYIKIAQLCLMMMYNNPGLTGEYDSNTEKTVKEFQNFYCLTQDSRVTPGVIGRTTWASLLSSKGDSTRTAKACDCSEQILSAAKEQKLKESYDIVGRYLTGTVGGTKPKSLSLEEIHILTENGLRIFPIYQDGGASLTYFSNEQGKIDAVKALNAARSLKIPNGTIIYFAVDYDFTEEQAKDRVVNHFKGINFVLSSSNAKYKVGIYGSRNICSIVCDEGLAVSSFVSDMSTGYSGNMGFPLPSNWAFDQIYEYTTTASDGTKFGVDKDVSSGRDNGFQGNELCGGDNFRDCTRHSMELQNDGYFACLSCGYRVPSPYLQDKEILSSDDFLRIQALTALYYITLGDDRRQHLLNPILENITTIRNESSDYIGKYSYHDADDQCIHIPPDGVYNDNYVQTNTHNPVVVTTLNINEYNGVFDELVDAIYGLAVDYQYSLTLSQVVADLLENPNLTMSLYEVIKYIADSAKQTGWLKILELIQLGVNIKEVQDNSKVEDGDIVVTFQYMKECSISEAQIIFDSYRQFKCAAYKL